MIKIFFLFLLPLTLFGSKILSYNIYDRTDRVDVMITFDTPYTGQIKKSTTESTIIIKLQDTSIESAKLKQISSKYLNTLSITPMANYVKIVASIPSNVVLKASKTSDSYGLRLRFQDKSLVSKNKTAQIQQTNSLSSLPTKKDSTVSDRYIIVVSLLIIGIIILFIIRRKVTPEHMLKNKEKQSKQKSWLFNMKDANTQPAHKQSSNNDNVSIRFQKNIDANNSVVMLDFMDQSYLVMMGSSNILLDKFTEGKPTTQEDFESILQEKHQVLEDFLSEKEQIVHVGDNKSPSYSQKASTITYNT